MCLSETLDNYSILLGKERKEKKDPFYRESATTYVRNRHHPSTLDIVA